jgi:hypothetical protein
MVPIDLGMIARWKAWKERRFLRKHGCETRIQYSRWYDPNCHRGANRIRDYYHGYPFIYSFEFGKISMVDLLGDWYQGIDDIREWCNKNCHNKWRDDYHRVWRENEDEDWRMDEMGGGDVLFFAFKEERDLMLFILRWV